MGSSPTPPAPFEALPENVLLAAGKAQATTEPLRPLSPSATSSSSTDMTQPLVAGVIIGSLLS